MYGYVVPDKPNMFMKDFTLYKAFYCGMCKSIGKTCGQLMRFGTSYDIAFLNILAHAIFDVDIVIENQTCVLNLVKKKSIVKLDDLSKKIVDINNILMHYKCLDDIIDNKSLFKSFVDKAILKKHYKKSKKIFSDLDKFINIKYSELRQLEKEDCAIIDKVADKFGLILQKVASELFGEIFDDNIGNIMYNLGKWIYIMDSVDDIEDDKKTNKYNMWLVDYKYESRCKFLEDRGEEARNYLMVCYNQIFKSFEQLKIAKYEGVLTNILWYGILEATKNILRGNEKCKKIRI